jgi:PAN domain
MRKMIFAMALWLAAWSLLPGDAAALERDIDRPGGDYKASYVDDASACERECRRNGGCRAWTYVKRDNHCMLKNTVPQARRDACCTSGVQKPIVIKFKTPQPQRPPQRQAQPPGIIDHGTCLNNDPNC